MRKANDRHFSSERAQYSGAQKRKRAKEKQRKENEATAKLLKYFKMSTKAASAVWKCSSTG